MAETGEGTETGREEGIGIEKEGVIAAVEEMEMEEITMITDRRETETGDSTTTATTTTTIVKKVSAIHRLCSP